MCSGGGVLEGCVSQGGVLEGCVSQGVSWGLVYPGGDGVFQEGGGVSQGVCAVGVCPRSG